MAYLLIILILLSFIYKGEHNKKYRFFAFVFMSICLGLRDKVGTDFESYKDYFDSKGSYLELGFDYLCSTISSLGGNATVMFFVVGVISLFFIYKSLNRLSINYVPTAILCYIFTFPFLSNGIRQGVAVSIFFYAYRFIEERKLFVFVVFILIASLFHASILIVLPLYFIIHRSYEKYIYIVLYVLSFLMIFSSIDIILQPLEQYISLHNRYMAYIDSGSSLLQGYFSFGIFSKLLLYFFIFYFSLKCEINVKYPVLFNLFFCAVILFNFRIASSLFGRIEIIFSWFEYLILPLVVCSKTFSKYRKIVVRVFVVIYVVFFMNVFYFDSNNCLYPYNNILLNYMMESMGVK